VTEDSSRDGQRVRIFEDGRFAPRISVRGRVPVSVIGLSEQRQQGANTFLLLLKTFYAVEQGFVPNMSSGYS
jgi:hypothetical protein